MPQASDPRLITRASGALALMSIRYWTTTIARTKRELQRWREHARSIPDPALRAVALAKLADEQANAYFAATFATLAPPPRRTTAIDVIVALQIIYDYLDGITEQTDPNKPLCDGHELFRALSDAVAPPAPHGGYYRHHPHTDDAGYLPQLVATARSGLAQLPASAAVADVASAAASRCAGAQVRAHATSQLGTAQLQRWAIEQSTQGDCWREYLASAASAIISIHALIAAAADSHTTAEQASRVDAFHVSTCALATILDGLADLPRDARSTDGQLGYLHYFPDRANLSSKLVLIARRAINQAPQLPNGGHHLMTLAGVAAYYLSAIGRPSEAVVAPLQHELQPVIAPPLLFMRSWRLAAHLRHRPPTIGANCPSL